MEIEFRMSSDRDGKFAYRLGLHPGDLVEVKARAEILATLDEHGSLDAMPFMPEMLDFCGKRFRVWKRADKTCDTITKTGGRRLDDTVHLEGIRCDGAHHGGCQAACLLFWKEAWLNKVGSGASELPLVSRVAATTFPARAAFREPRDVCTEQALHEAARQANGGPGNDPSEVAYRCQATELVRATRPLAWWDVRQYARDVLRGNVTLGRALRVLTFSLFRNYMRRGVGYRVLKHSYNRFQDARGGVRWPYETGEQKKTPGATLGLEPGELVEVKSHDEILATLNPQNRNRGLSFDAEMVPYCGRTFRVLARVEKILDEKTGKMMALPNDCVILEGVTCQANYSELRLFCPRAIYPYWREIWLRRVGTDAANPDPRS